MIKDFPISRRASSIGMFIFLVALAMLFAASLLGYVWIRIHSPEITFGSVRLPHSLWLSTALILFSSVTIHLALSAIRRERHEAFRTFLSATMVFAGLFIVVQTPAMAQLYHRNSTLMQEWQEERLANPKPIPKATDSHYDEMIPGQRSVPFYALVMVLILIHALHVVGGMVSLGVVAYRGYKGKYDHENYAGVRNCAAYWHFLDAVWIVMFVVLAGFG